MKKFGIGEVVVAVACIGAFVTLVVTGHNGWAVAMVILGLVLLDT